MSLSILNKSFVIALSILPFTFTQAGMVSAGDVESEVTETTELEVQSTELETSSEEVSDETGGEIVDKGDGGGEGEEVIYTMFSVDEPTDDGGGDLEVKGEPCEHEESESFAEEGSEKDGELGEEKTECEHLSDNPETESDPDMIKRSDMNEDSENPEIFYTLGNFSGAQTGTETSTDTSQGDNLDNTQLGEDILSNDGATDSNDGNPAAYKTTTNEKFTIEIEFEN
jgi:hypothetical protein